MIQSILERTRSYRRFYEEKKVSKQDLKELVNLARMSASAQNRQALKFKICTDDQLKEEIFPLITWAAMLKNWKGPIEGERPGAYIIIIEDLEIKSACPELDTGIAAQSIMIGASALNLGGCMILSVNQDKLLKAAGLDPERFRFRLLLALGYPKEKVVMVPIGDDGDCSYYRNKNQVHHVPKRGLSDILL